MLFFKSELFVSVFFPDSVAHGDRQNWVVQSLCPKNVGSILFFLSQKTENNIKTGNPRVCFAGAT